MSHIRVLICRVDDPASDQMTALAAVDLPETDLTTLKPETALDDLETTTHTTGNAILQRALQAQWDVIDDQLTVQHRQSFPPRTIHADGHEPITVASRFGILTLSRQVCQHLATQTHVIPSNAVLPSHNGIIITRGLHLLGLSVVAGVALCLRRTLAGLADPRCCDPLGHHNPQPRPNAWPSHPSGGADRGHRIGDSGRSRELRPEACAQRAAATTSRMAGRTECSC